MARSKKAVRIPTEEEAILAARAGNDTAVSEILGRYSIDKRFYNMAFRILRNKEDAEDVLQEACVLALRKWRQFRGDSKFRTWFTRIVITSSLMAQRGKPEFVEVKDDMITCNGVERMAVESERRERLFAAIERLESPIERRATWLRVDDLTVREVADILGCPLGTAKTYVLRAKANLKEALEGKV